MSLATIGATAVGGHEEKHVVIRGSLGGSHLDQDAVEIMLRNSDVWRSIVVSGSDEHLVRSVLAKSRPAV
jgi:hypothetical protein